MRSFVLGLLLLAQLFVLLGPTFPVPRVWALETVYDTLTGNTADPDVSDWNDIGGGELAGSVYVDPSVEATLISATFELCGSFGVQAGGFDLLVFPTTGAVAQKPTGDAPVWPDLGTAIARSDVYAQATDFNLGWTGTTCNGTLFTFEFSGVNRITLVPGTDYGFIFRKQTTTLGPIHYYQDPDGPQIDRCASFEGVGWSCEDITGVPLLVTGQVEAGGGGSGTTSGNLVAAARGTPLR